MYFGSNKRGFQSFKLSNLTCCADLRTSKKDTTKFNLVEMHVRTCVYYDLVSH